MSYKLKISEIEDLAANEITIVQDVATTQEEISAFVMFLRATGISDKKILEEFKDFINDFKAVYLDKE